MITFKSETIAEQQTEIEHLNEQVDNLLKEQFFFFFLYQRNITK